MDVLVVGAGLMGSQIAAEYALAGNRVHCLARHPADARARVDAALDTALRLGLHDEAAAEAAAERVTAGAALEAVERCDLVVESVPEDLAIKGAVLSPIAVAFPSAVIASNTSSLSIGEIGDACGAPERTVGTHYWNPPLLMPLVEVVRFGNARRWEHVGPFAAAALGGIGTWQRVAGELFPVLSNARDAGDLGRALWADEAKLAEIASARDEGLARGLRSRN